MGCGVSRNAKHVARFGLRKATLAEDLRGGLARSHTARRLQRPHNEVHEPFPGGRVWTDAWMLGSQDDAFQMLIPDIRLPANQYWPLHWHDCWIAIVVLEGTCLVGDWWMEKGDVLISAAEVEYGPLVIGAQGCQMFEIFAQLHLSAGGYAPEYRDHPTLQGGNHVFTERSERNRGNERRSTLPVDGLAGLVKGHLDPGSRWNLGESHDPERGVIGYTSLEAGEVIAPHSYSDWHTVFLMEGSLDLGGMKIAKHDVILVQPNARIDAMKAGLQGAQLFEAARTARGMDRRL